MDQARCGGHESLSQASVVPSGECLGFISAIAQVQEDIKLEDRVLHSRRRRSQLLTLSSTGASEMPVRRLPA